MAYESWRALSKTTNGGDGTYFEGLVLDVGHCFEQLFGVGNRDVARKVVEVEPFSVVQVRRVVVENPLNGAGFVLWAIKTTVSLLIVISM